MSAQSFKHNIWLNVLVGLVVGWVLGTYFVPAELKPNQDWSGWNQVLRWRQWILTIGMGGGFGWLTPYLQASPHLKHTNSYGMGMSVFLIGAWLVPMTMTGALQSNMYHIPAPIRNQYRISCLFTHPSRSWHTVHYEVRLAGQLRWKEGPLEGYFDLDIFGYRSRLNRIVLASRYKNKQGEVYGRNKLRLEEMGQFIAERWATLNPEATKVQEVRFTRVAHKVGEKHCMARERWSRPALSDIPKKDHDLIHTVRIRHE